MLLTAEERGRRRICRSASAEPLSEFDAPENAAGHVSRDHPSGLSPDISNSGLDSDYAPAAHASAANAPAAERRLASSTSRTPRTPIFVSSRNASAGQKSSRKGPSSDSGRPHKKIRAEMKLGFDVVASELRDTLNQQVGNLEISASRRQERCCRQFTTQDHLSLLREVDGNTTTRVQKWTN